MKIGIITQPLRANYGGLLQNYALQKVLRDKGYEVETLDWGEMPKLRQMLSNLKSKVKFTFTSSNNRFYRPTAEETAIIRTNTNRFIDKYITRTSPIKREADFSRLESSNKYDAYIVGSDQVWRPCYNNYLKEMFLDFAQDRDVKRIAYAASFGTDIWEYNEEEEKCCSELAKKFDLITVREDSGINLCKEHLGVNASIVSDPTMLLTREDYIQLVEGENEPQSTGSLFYYVLDPNPEIKEFIDHIASSTGLVPFQKLPKYCGWNISKEVVKYEIDKCIFPSVTSWIKAFMDAELVIVDSFHGMVFSILFNKPFWVIGNKKRGMSRFTSLLRQFDLEDRLIEPIITDNFNFKAKVCWDSVNQIIEENRHKSLDVLYKTLNN